MRLRYGAVTRTKFRLEARLDRDGNAATKLPDRPDRVAERRHAGSKRAARPQVVWSANASSRSLLPRRQSRQLALPLRVSMSPQLRSFSVRSEIDATRTRDLSQSGVRSMPPAPEIFLTPSEKDATCTGDLSPLPSEKDATCTGDLSPSWERKMPPAPEIFLVPERERCHPHQRFFSVRVRSMPSATVIFLAGICLRRACEPFHRQAPAFVGHLRGVRRHVFPFIGHVLFDD